MTVEDRGYTIQEITEIYDITGGAVRMAIKRGNLIEGKDCMKFGWSWVIFRGAAERLWGHKKKINQSISDSKKYNIERTKSIKEL